MLLSQTQQRPHHVKEKGRNTDREQETLRSAKRRKKNSISEGWQGLMIRMWTFFMFYFPLLAFWMQKEHFDVLVVWRSSCSSLSGTLMSLFTFATWTWYHFFISSLESKLHVNIANEDSKDPDRSYWEIIQKNPLQNIDFPDIPSWSEAACEGDTSGHVNALFDVSWVMAVDVGLIQSQRSPGITRLFSGWVVFAGRRRVFFWTRARTRAVQMRFSTVQVICCNGGALRMIMTLLFWSYWTFLYWHYKIQSFYYFTPNQTRSA